MTTAQQLAPGLWRVPLETRTMPPYSHTNSYLVASRGVAAIVDPAGSDNAVTILERLARQAGVTLVKAVLLTHTHADHVSGLTAVLEKFERPELYGHPLELNRLDGVRATALTHRRNLTVGDHLVTALHTPGHSPGSLSFHLPAARAVLVGDLIAGDSSSWVGWPDGDVADYLASLQLIAGLAVELIGPGHGAPVEQPQAKLAEARAHRLAREGQVIAELKRNQHTLSDLRKAIYSDVGEEVRDLAERSLLAHLKKLMNEMRVVHLGDDEQGPYALRS